MIIIHIVAAMQVNTYYLDAYTHFDENMSFCTEKTSLGYLHVSYLLLSAIAVSVDVLFY